MSDVIVSDGRIEKVSIYSRLNINRCLDKFYINNIKRYAIYLRLRRLFRVAQ